MEAEQPLTGTWRKRSGLQSMLRHKEPAQQRRRHGHLAALQEVANRPAEASSRIMVTMCRHGERLDETSEKYAWFRSCGEKWHDPPLTATGKAQAAAAGDRLRTSTPLGDASAYGRVLTSPLQRCVETAVEVAVALQLPIQVVLGLSECAAACRGRLGSTVFLTDQEVAALVDGRAPVLPRDSTVESFEQCIQRMVAECPAATAAAASGQPAGDGGAAAAAVQEADGVALESGCAGALLLVTHREGIKMALGDRSRGRVPYCGIEHFDVAYYPQQQRAVWNVHVVAPVAADPTTTPPPADPSPSPPRIGR